MGTYYKFICPECKISGGFLSRQAWGLGNFDIIESFKFCALHKDHRPFLEVEQTDDYDNTPTVDDTKESWEKFIGETHGMMPHSNDWAIVKENEWNGAEEKWEKIEKHFYP